MRTKQEQIEAIERSIRESVEEIETLNFQKENYEPDPEDFENEFNDYLDSEYDTMKIGYIYISPSDAFRNCDLTAYEMYRNEWVESWFESSPVDFQEYQDILNEIEEEESRLEELEEKLTNLLKEKE